MFQFDKDYSEVIKIFTKKLKVGVQLKSATYHREVRTRLIIKLVITYFQRVYKYLCVAVPVFSADFIFIIFCFVSFTLSNERTNQHLFDVFFHISFLDNEPHGLLCGGGRRRQQWWWRSWWLLICSAGWKNLSLSVSESLFFSLYSKNFIGVQPNVVCCARVYRFTQRCDRQQSHIPFFFTHTSVQGS